MTGVAVTIFHVVNCGKNQEVAMHFNPASDSGHYNSYGLK